MLTPIAIKVLSPNSIGKRKLKPYQIYYLLEGFDIKDNGYMYIQSYRLKADTLYQNYFSEKGVPHVSISAIVGENGSGKSSLVEFYMRLINNFAAATIGEYEVNPGAKHLHYINNIEGEFYYLIDKVPYRLRVQSRNVILENYSSTGRRTESNSEEFLLYNTAYIFDNEMSTEHVENDSDISPMQAWRLPKHKQGQSEEYILNIIYKHFFYSYISNYSIYAYNTTDFCNECNSNDYEAIIRKENKKKKYDCENKNWLSGIFHKNDGYQTPIVLTPFRTQGNIDINTENTLSKERLMTLLIMPRSQFRTINGHLVVSGFKLTKKKTVYNAKYLNRTLGFKRLQQKGYEKFQALIVQYWSEAIAVELQEYAGSRIAYGEAVGYLVYKTLKISSKYRQYNSFFKNHSNIAHKIDEEALKHLIETLNIDHSHITKKIRQILAYIIYGTYEFKDTFQSFDIEEISQNMEKIMFQRQAYTDDIQKKQFIFSIDDLVPPPIYDVNIELEDNKDKTPILFETLSSGERQQTYSISALLYHLSNLESVWQDSNKQRIAYGHVNVIMEEIELYFHPELQRTYIKNVLDGIKQVQLAHIESINICFVTHSPFVLSDIPSRNILALKIEDEYVNISSRQMSTFGANIHDMLKNSFFLEHGPIGAYADWVIRNIIKKMEMVSKGHMNVNTLNVHEEIMLIDEPIVRMALLDEYHRVVPNNDPELRIKELQLQIQELKKQKLKNRK